MIQRLKAKSEFSRNVLTLMTGTTIAQAIPIAISPILTRLYTPEDFGVLALYMALVSIMAVVVTLRYELAIVQPQEEEDAASLVVLSMFITIVLSGTLLLVIYFFHQVIVQLLGNDAVVKWLYLLPVSILVIGLYQALNYWNTRRKHYKTLAYAKITNGLGSSSSQVGLGVSHVPGGLIIGYITGQCIALFFLILMRWKENQTAFRRVTTKKIWRNAKKYSKLPKYSAAGAFANAASQQIPVLILSKFYDMHITGMYSLTLRVLSVPAALMSSALSQVLHQKLAQMHHESPSQIKGLILKIFFMLLAVMMPFVILMWLFGEPLFAFVFGEPWREAGTLAAILVIAVAVRFAVSPLSIVLVLEHNVKMGVLWQFIYLFTMAITLYSFSGQSVTVFLIAFVVHEVILYSLYMVFILKGAQYL